MLSNAHTQHTPAIRAVLYQQVSSWLSEAPIVVAAPAAVVWRCCCCQAACMNHEVQRVQLIASAAKQPCCRTESAGAAGGRNSAHGLTWEQCLATAFHNLRVQT